MNQFKTGLLLTALTLLLVWIGNLLGGQQGMLMAFIFALAMNFFSYWFSDRIVLKLYRAKEVDESSAPQLYRITRGLVQAANLPMPKIYIMDNPTPNAFATGRNPDHAAVAVTTGIMNLLDENEISGVIAHELAHIKNRDILISTIAATIAGAISLIASWARWGAIFGMGDNRDRGGANLVVALVLGLVASLAAMIIQMAISRSREYLADATGAKICGNPQYLASALRKLAIGNERMPMQESSSATAHMFIVNPLSGGGLTKLFSTHPPMQERISRLEAMSRSPRPAAA